MCLVVLAQEGQYNLWFDSHFFFCSKYEVQYFMMTLRSNKVKWTPRAPGFALVLYGRWSCLWRWFGRCLVCRALVTERILRRSLLHDHTWATGIRRWFSRLSRLGYTYNKGKIVFSDGLLRKWEWFLRHAPHCILVRQFNTFAFMFRKSVRVWVFRKKWSSAFFHRVELGERYVVLRFFAESVHYTRPTSYYFIVLWGVCK